MSEVNRRRIEKLDTLANHPNTPAHEAASARAKADELRAKTPQPQRGHKADKIWFDKNDAWFREMIRQDAILRAREAQQRRMRMEAQGWVFATDMNDIFDEALRNDPRTVAQRNWDIQNSFGQQHKD